MVFKLFYYLYIEKPKNPDNFMKTASVISFNVTALLSIALMAFTSCAPQIELTSSWTNKQAEVKSTPKIMVMVLGSNLSNRQWIEKDIVTELGKLGHQAIGSLDDSRQQ